jgi:hypothetical protein
VTFMVIVIQRKILEVLSQCTKAGNFQKVRARVSTIVGIKQANLGDTFEHLRYVPKLLCC